MNANGFWSGFWKSEAMGMYSQGRFALPESAFAAVSAALILAVVGITGCATEHQSEPTVIIESPADGETVMGPSIKIKVKTTGFKYATVAAAKGSAVQHEEEDVSGHIHVFVDKPGLLDADAVTNITKSDTARFDIATAGSHYIIVAGADAKHRNLAGMRDSIRITVTLP